MDKIKGIKFLQRNLSMISNDLIRHDPSLVAASIIELICDDLKYQDKQNDPQYLMLNTKLREEKRINKIKKKMAKKEQLKAQGKLAKREKNWKGKSKFSNKYSERIKSIREADKKAKLKTEKEQAKRRKQKTTNRNKANNKAEIEERKPKSARGRKKSPQEIREEMLKKLNETK